MEAIVPDEYDPRGKKYHRVVVTRHGGPDVLQVVEEDLPEPRAGEVRVKILAAGVSAYDLMQRRPGSLPGTPSVPYTPGEDVIGAVDKLGEGVSAVEWGQRVAGYPRGGGYAEFICLPASELVPVPAGVDPAEAVGLVANYLTAHMLMHGTVGVRSAFRWLRPLVLMSCLSAADTPARCSRRQSIVKVSEHGAAGEYCLACN